MPGPGAPCHGCTLQKYSSWKRAPLASPLQRSLTSCSPSSSGRYVPAHLLLLVSKRVLSGLLGNCKLVVALSPHKLALGRKFRAGAQTTKLSCMHMEPPASRDISNGRPELAGLAKYPHLVHDVREHMVEKKPWLWLRRCTFHCFGWSQGHLTDFAGE